jgi:hypothetical protein
VYEAPRCRGKKAVGESLVDEKEADLVARILIAVRKRAFHCRISSRDSIVHPSIGFMT